MGTTASLTRGNLTITIDFGGKLIDKLLATPEPVQTAEDEVENFVGTTATGTHIMDEDIERWNRQDCGHCARETPGLGALGQTVIYTNSKGQPMAAQVVCTPESYAPEGQDFDGASDYRRGRGPAPALRGHEAHLSVTGPRSGRRVIRHNIPFSESGEPRTWRYTGPRV